MYCYFDPRHPFFAGVPAPLLDRAIQEAESDTLATWGIQTDGGTAHGITVELSASTAANFLSWCGTFNIVRCDVDRASDFACFLGRTPLCLSAIQLFENDPGVRGQLSGLQPDELYTTLSEFADSVLQLSNALMAQLQAEVEQGNDIAQVQLDTIRHQSELTFRQAGFDMPEERSLDPEPEPDFKHSEEFYEEFGGGSEARPMRRDAFGNPF